MLFFDKLTRSILIVFAAMSFGSGLYGCASVGIQTTGEPKSDVFSIFAKGEARLTCGVTCSGASGWSRSDKTSFFEGSHWKDLALEVARVGYEIDREYFYLGRAAEGLGYKSAARTYYKLALATTHKCSGLINVCDGFIFPRDISVRLNILDQQVAKAAVEKAAVEKAAVEKAAVEKAAVEKAAVEKAAMEAAENSEKAAAKESVKKVARVEYVSESDHEKQNEADKNTKFIAALDDVRGKTFWYRPNPKAEIRIEFIEPGNSGGVPPYPHEQKFFVTKETSFVVLGYELGNYDKYYLKLEFPDGKIGYLAVYSLATMFPDKYPVIENLYPSPAKDLSFYEYIFSRPPQEIFAAEKKAAAARQAKQAKAAAEWKARGGVSIGMTTTQALKSSWGKPNKINRTITPNGTHEQWVYGGHNFLYFENGIMTSIQN